MARQLIIELVGKADKFTKTLGDAEKASKSFGDKVSDAGKKMSAFVSVPIAGFLVGATKAAMDDAAAQAHLATTLGNTIGNSKDLVAQVEAYITKAQKVSTFTDDELRPAFETLATTTHSVTESQNLLQVAMDVAAGKGIDLETATKAVAKAHEGQFTAVNKLVPGLIDLNDKTLTADQAVGKLASTFNGQAIAATETTAGKMRNLKRDLGEAAESMGAKLLPAVTSFASFTTNTLLPAMDKISGGNGAFVLLGLAAAGPVLSNIAKLKTGIDALNLSLDATAVKAAAALGAVGLLYFGAKDLINDINDGLEKNQGLLGKSKSLLNSILGGGADKGIFGKNFLGLRASGGPVSPSGSYIVGEKGPELFTPGSPGTIIPNGAVIGAGGGGMTVVVNVSGSVIAERDLGRVVADAIRDNGIYGVS